MFRTDLKILATILVAASLIAHSHAAGRKGSMESPDFTKGDPIPEGATHDWTLGATGARGWMYSKNLTTMEARQIMVTEVAEDSPADGVLEVGDVILGVGGEPFSYDARTEFGKALTAAETEVGGGNLVVTRWRKGQAEKVVVEIPVLGTYSATAPFDCPKSKRIFEEGCEALAEKMKSSDYRENPIVRSLNAMALLSSGEAKYNSLIRREVEWAEDFSAESFATWYYGYVMIFLAEYKLATGSNSGMDGLRRIALEAANGQSNVGSWGHRFAEPDGRAPGYGMMNAPGVPLTTGLILAREAGVDGPEMDLAIERSLKMMRFYVDKGSVPYGDHAPWIQTHDDNGKNGMSAVMFSLVDEADKAEYFSRMSLASHGNERDTGHTGNFWNMTWAMPGVVRSGPNASGAWMKEFGSWYFDLARGWDGTFRHQGPPNMKPDRSNGWDASGSFLLAYAMPLKQLYLTGKHPTKVPQLSAEEARSIIMDGRGWNNIDRSSIYEKLQIEMLVEGLGSWSPVVRNRSAMALVKHTGEVPINVILNMLNSPDLHSSYGACEALAMLGAEASDAVPDLIKALDRDDLWLRVQAAEALTAIGEQAMEALPKLLQMLAQGPTEDDPRNMQQRYLSFTVFGKMLKNSIEDVDKDLLREAIVAGLQNQDGRSRGSIGGVYNKLSYDEIEPILPAILESVVVRAPSGMMFADGIRLSGLDLLAKHKIEEGIPLCVDVMDIGRWGAGNRIPRCLNILTKYGRAAKSEILRLKEIIKQLEGGRQAKQSAPVVEQITKAIEKIESSKDRVRLKSLK